MLRNIKLVLAYDGTSYHGWERQKQFRTLQATLEQAIASLCGEQSSVIASGRTDAGVHALGQVANFRTGSRHDCATIRRGLNALLPDDFRVLAAEDAPEGFHATHGAKSKLYRYVIHDAPVLDPFLRRYVYHSNWPLDDEAMQGAARCLVGTHDFSSFETAGAPRMTSVRSVSRCAVVRSGPAQLWSRNPVGAPPRSGIPASNLAASDPSASPSATENPRLQRPSFVYLEVAADGFLYNMVRALAGSLINVGRGYWSADRVPEILAARDRTQAGPTAPPHGLFLVRVDYGPDER